MNCKYIDKRISCVGSNTHVRCSQDMIGVMCTAHTSLWFMVTLGRNRIKNESNSKTLKYLTPTRRSVDGVIIPFPYKIQNDTVCRDSDAEVIAALTSWISKMDMNRENQCRTLNILGTLFLENVFDVEYLKEYAEFSSGANLFRASFNQRFKDARVAYVQNNQVGTISANALPVVIKMLLFYTEMSTNTNGNGTFTTPFNLYLDLDQKGIVLHKDQDEELMYYDDDYNTDLSTRLVVAGEDTADSNIYFGRTLMGITPNPKVFGISECV